MKKGFSLIELIVTIATSIILINIAFLVWQHAMTSDHQRREERTSFQRALLLTKQIENALDTINIYNCSDGEIHTHEDNNFLTQFCSTCGSAQDTLKVKFNCWVNDDLGDLEEWSEANNHVMIEFQGTLGSAILIGGVLR